MQKSDDFNAFLDASDDEESLQLTQRPAASSGSGGYGGSPYVGGGLGGGSMGIGTSGFGMGGFGMSASMGRTASQRLGYAGGDPLASMDFDAINAMQQAQAAANAKVAGKAAEAKAKAAAKAKATAARKGAAASDVPKPLASELRRATASRSPEPSGGSGASRSASPPVRSGSVGKRIATPSDSEEESESQTQTPAGAAAPSMFATFLKDMQETAAQAEQLRLKQKAEEEEKQRKAEEEKQRKDAERKAEDERKLREEEEKKKRAEEEEQARRKAEEEHKRLEAEERQKKQDEEVTDRRRKEAEIAKQLQEEQAFAEAKEQQDKKEREEAAKVLKKEPAFAEQSEEPLRQPGDVVSADILHAPEDPQRVQEEQEQTRSEDEHRKKQEELKRIHDEKEQKKREEEDKQKKQEELQRLYEQQERNRKEEEQRREEEAERKRLVVEQEQKRRAEELEFQRRKEAEEQDQLLRVYEEQEEERRREEEEDERRRSWEAARRPSEPPSAPPSLPGCSPSASPEGPMPSMRSPWRTPAASPVGSSPRLPLPAPPYRTTVPQVGGATSDSMAGSYPMLGSVVGGQAGVQLSDSTGGFASGIVASCGGGPRRAASPEPSTSPAVAVPPRLSGLVKEEDDDRFRLRCTDGKLLVLRCTDSAEEEERQAYWRARGQGQLAESNDFSRTLDATSVLLGSTAIGGGESFGIGGFPLAAAGFSSRVGLPIGRLGTLSPEEIRAELDALASSGVGLRSAAAALRATGVERGQLEILQSELKTLLGKLALLEDYNTELAEAKSSAEAAAVKMEGQVIDLRHRCRKMQDKLSAAEVTSREKDALLEMLQQQLQASRDGLEAAAEAVAEREALASHLAAVEAEVAGLSEERDTLQQDLDLAASARPRKAALAEAASDAAAEATARQLQQELEVAEGMLRSYEKENEALAQQNRQLRQASRLRREEVDGRQLQLVAELNAAKATAEANPASMRRVAELERELVLARERVEEHARELERCRETKRQLERELLNGPVAAAVPEDIAAKLAEAQAQQRRAEEDSAQLREKLRWYAESQREMEEDRLQVERLEDEVHGLRSECSELRRRPSAKEANRRVAELRKQVEELSECLRKRHPDSLLSLVKACEPPPEERRELRELRARVEELEGKLADRDTMYDRRVRALRAQYDHLRQEYERRLGSSASGAGGGDAGAGGARAAAPDREAVLTARIKDLERQVEHTKSYYLTKLRNREPLVPAKPAARGGGGLSQQREAELQQALRERDARIEELSQTLQQLQRGPEVVGSGAAAAAQAAAAGSKAAGALAPPPAPALLRLFLASPEAPALAAVSTELRAMAQAARRLRFGEVATQARALLALLSAEESAAGTFHLEAAVGHAVGQDALRLSALPPLPCDVWAAWRRLASQIVAAAAEAELRSEGTASAGSGPRGGRAAAAELVVALAALRGCVEDVLSGLLFGGGAACGRALRSSREAWPAAARETAPARAESLLPRLLLEHLREEIDVAGDAHAAAILQDAEVHAGLDHKLPWHEFVGVLRRCGVGGERLLIECHGAADPDWSLSLSELRWLLSGAQGTQAPPSPCVGLVRTLTRIRLAAVSHDPPLLVLFREFDAEGRGFLPRPDFMEALGAIHCALSLEERVQLAAFFSPASDPRWVCYPLLLQSVVPSRDEVALGGFAGHSIAVTASPAAFSRSLPGPGGHSAWAAGAARGGLDWRAGAQPPLGAGQGLHPEFALAAPHPAAVAAKAKAAELEVENEGLRDRLRMLDRRVAEQDELLSRTPAQAVRRLQREVAALEAHLLEGQAGAATAARKAELTLWSDLEVSRHEAAALRRALEAKDRELERYKIELEAIIAELSRLQGTRKAQR